MGAINKTPIKNVVVFSNNKTIINTKNANNYVNEKIVRVDGLIEYLKRELKNPSPVHFFDNQMMEISEYIKSSHSEKIIEETDYVEVKLLEETINNSDDIIKQVENPQQIEKVENPKLEESLKQYRLKIAKEQNVKAFYIFTNKALDELMQKQPCTLEELKSIHGFGEKKIEAFGKGLIEIIKQHHHYEASLN